MDKTDAALSPQLDEFLAKVVAQHPDDTGLGARSLELAAHETGEKIYVEGLRAAEGTLSTAALAERHSEYRGFFQDALARTGGGIVSPDGIGDGDVASFGFQVRDLYLRRKPEPLPETADEDDGTEDMESAAASRHDRMVEELENYAETDPDGFSSLRAQLNDRRDAGVEEAHLEDAMLDAIKAIEKGDAAGAAKVLKAALKTDETDPEHEPNRNPKAKADAEVSASPPKKGQVKVSPASDDLVYFQGVGGAEGSRMYYDTRTKSAEYSGGSGRTLTFLLSGNGKQAYVAALWEQGRWVLDAVSDSASTRITKTTRGGGRNPNDPALLVSGLGDNAAVSVATGKSPPSWAAGMIRRFRKLEASVDTEEARSLKLNILYKQARSAINKLKRVTGDKTDISDELLFRLTDCANQCLVAVIDHADQKELKYRTKRAATALQGVQRAVGVAASVDVDQLKADLETAAREKDTKTIEPVKAEYNKAMTELTKLRNRMERVSHEERSISWNAITAMIGIRWTMLGLDNIGKDNTKANKQLRTGAEHIREASRRVIGLVSASADEETAAETPKLKRLRRAASDAADNLLDYVSANYSKKGPWLLRYAVVRMIDGGFGLMATHEVGNEAGTQSNLRKIQSSLKDVNKYLGAAGKDSASTETAAGRKQNPRTVAKDIADDLSDYLTEYLDGRFPDDVSALKAVLGNKPALNYLKDEVEDTVRAYVNYAEETSADETAGGNSIKKDIRLVRNNIDGAKISLKGRSPDIDNALHWLDSADRYAKRIERQADRASADIEEADSQQLYRQVSKGHEDAPRLLGNMMTALGGMFQKAFAVELNYSDAMRKKAREGLVRVSKDLLGASTFSQADVRRMVNEAMESASADETAAAIEAETMSRLGLTALDLHITKISLRTSEVMTSLIGWAAVVDQRRTVFLRNKGMKRGIEADVGKQLSSKLVFKSVEDVVKQAEKHANARQGRASVEVLAEEMAGKFGVKSLTASEQADDLAEKLIHLAENEPDSHWLDMAKDILVTFPMQARKSLAGNRRLMSRLSRTWGWSSNKRNWNELKKMLSGKGVASAEVETAANVVAARMTSYLPEPAYHNRKQVREGHTTFLKQGSTLVCRGIGIYVKELRGEAALVFGEEPDRDEAATSSAPEVADGVSPKPENAAARNYMVVQPYSKTQNLYLIVDILDGNRPVEWVGDKAFGSRMTRANAQKALKRVQRRPGENKDAKVVKASAEDLATGSGQLLEGDAHHGGSRIRAWEIYTTKDKHGKTLYVYYAPHQGRLEEFGPFTDKEALKRDMKRQRGSKASEETAARHGPAINWKKAFADAGYLDTWLRRNKGWAIVMNNKSGHEYGMLYHHPKEPILVSASYLSGTRSWAPTQITPRELLAAINKFEEWSVNRLMDFRIASLPGETAETASSEGKRVGRVRIIPQRTESGEYVYFAKMPDGSLDGPHPDQATAVQASRRIREGKREVLNWETANWNKIFADALRTHLERLAGSQMVRNRSAGQLTHDIMEILGEHSAETRKALLKDRSAVRSIKKAWKNSPLDDVDIVELLSMNYRRGGKATASVTEEAVKRLDPQTKRMVKGWIKSFGGDKEKTARWMKDKLHLGDIKAMRRLVDLALASEETAAGGKWIKDDNWHWYYESGGKWTHQIYLLSRGKYQLNKIKPVSAGATGIKKLETVGTFPSLTKAKEALPKKRYTRESVKKSHQRFRRRPRTASEETAAATNEQRKALRDVLSGKAKVAVDGKLSQTRKKVYYFDADMLDHRLAGFSFSGNHRDTLESLRSALDSGRDAKVRRTTAGGSGLFFRFGSQTVFAEPWQGWDMASTDEPPKRRSRQATAVESEEAA